MHLINQRLRLEQGSILVDQAGTTMQEVVSSIRRVTDLMGEISSASAEQSEGVSQVGKAVSQMDQATQQNAALVEQIAAAASSLKGLSNDLVKTVGMFKLNGVNISSMRQSHQIAVRANHISAVPYRETERQIATSFAPSNELADLGINLDSAIQAHADWRTKLRAAAAKQERLDADTIGKDDCCEIGKWLHGKGRAKFGSMPNFVNLIDGHKAFHIEAAKVASAVNQGNSDVDRMLGSGSPFSTASNEVGRLIVQLKRDLRTPPRAAERQATPTAVAKVVPSGGEDGWETF